MHMKATLFVALAAVVVTAGCIGQIFESGQARESLETLLKASALNLSSLGGYSAIYQWERFQNEEQYTYQIDETFSWGNVSQRFTFQKPYEIDFPTYKFGDLSYMCIEGICSDALWQPDPDLRNYSMRIITAILENAEALKEMKYKGIRTVAGRNCHALELDAEFGGEEILLFHFIPITIVEGEKLRIGICIDQSNGLVLSGSFEMLNSSGNLTVLNLEVSEKPLYSPWEGIYNDSLPAYCQRVLIKNGTWSAGFEQPPSLDISFEVIHPDANVSEMLQTFKVAILFQNSDTALFETKAIGYQRKEIELLLEAGQNPDIVIIKPKDCPNILYSIHKKQWFPSGLPMVG
ncbi:MAG: hypothetical protein QXL81_03250 [Candidatus Aenigmatarchaeota archaeon]